MIIKEYCAESSIAVIRDNNYGSNLDKFIAMYQEALKDYPYLMPRDVTVVKYGGSRYAKTFGIEFPTKYAPDEYTRIGMLEYT